MSKQIITIAASILSRDPLDLPSDIKLLEEAGINILHLDVMDGDFVDSITFGPSLISAIRKRTKMFFDAHLMINNPRKHLDPFIKAGCDSITIHLEAKGNILESLQYLRSQNIKTGLAINPETPIENIIEYLPLLDQVLVMTVHPGCGGQPLIIEAANKIPPLYSIIKEKGFSTKIAVDGGINADSISLLDLSKIDCLVVGSYLFKDNMQLQISKLGINKSPKL